MARGLFTSAIGLTAVAGGLLTVLVIGVPLLWVFRPVATPQGDADRVRQVVVDNSGDIGICASKGGSAVARVKVNDSGKATVVKIRESTLQEKGIDTCIIRAIKNMSFNPGPHVVDVPLTFQES